MFWIVSWDYSKCLNRLGEVILMTIQNITCKCRSEKNKYEFSSKCLFVGKLDYRFFSYLVDFLLHVWLHVSEFFSGNIFLQYGFRNWSQAKAICVFRSNFSCIDGEPSDWRPGHEFNPRRGQQHSFVEIDHEIFSTDILSLPLIQEGQLSVSGERMCTILVNRLED